jgi:hypothetical protein
MKTTEERKLEQLLTELIERLNDADEGGAEYKFILRQMEGVRRGSQMGGLLMEEYDIGGMRAVRHWSSY